MFLPRSLRARPNLRSTRHGRQSQRQPCDDQIGIDIGKNTFHLVGLDERGAIVLRQKLSRGQVTAGLANMVPCLIGMEACVGAISLLITGIGGLGRPRIVS